MDGSTLARALHVVAIVHWIGGVSMVTLVLLPQIRRHFGPEDQLSLFALVEGSFARQAKASTLIAGLSGFYMVHVFDLWERFFDPSAWWLHVMVVVWLIFSLVLFVAEPLFLHRWFHDFASEEPERAFRLLQRFHILLLLLSTFTIAAGVLGAHSAL